MTGSSRPGASRPGSHRPRARLFGGRIVAVAACAVAIVCSLFMTSGAAVAAWVDVVENGILGHLSLRSDPMPATFTGMSPGSVAHWQVNANLNDEEAELTLQVERDGALAARPDGLQLLVQRCAAEWTGLPDAPHCPAAAGSGATTVLGPLPASATGLGALGPLDVAGAPAFPAGTLTRGAGSFLLVTMSIPDTPEARADESLMGIEATLGLRFTASGDEPRPRDLPYTGTDATAAVLLAAGAVGLGLVLSSARRRKVRS